MNHKRSNYLHHFFENSALEYPDAACVVGAGKVWSYHEINDHATRMAACLASDEGIEIGCRVAIMMPPGVEAYLAILAVLKSGATFVALDPTFPPERVDFILEDSQAKLLLDAETVKALMARTGAGDFYFAPKSIESSQLAYIIYTSGTTGKPKGVGISHSNIANFLSVVPSIYGVGPDDRVYQGMTPSFDFSLEEIWPTWIAGAALVPPPNGEKLIGDELHAFLEHQRVSVLYAVPTLLASIQKDLPGLHTINVGGEACSPELVKRWHQPWRRILNTYGPTETTITATWTELSKDRLVTIGKPLPTYAVHLLDEDLKKVAHGLPGEICISGPGVSPGYINRPELNLEKFPVLDGTRIYKTGDLGRYTSDGEIEFLGRIDTQVKIRGHRVELGEIESLFRKGKSIENVVVHPFSEYDGDLNLVAYLLIKKECHLSDQEKEHILSELRAALPAHMIPAYLEILEFFPTLPSGKIDRSKLPAPRQPRLTSTNTTYTPPHGALEEAIAAVWQKHFKRNAISSQANFFYDLGGDSLAAAIIVSSLREDPRFADLSFKDLYLLPTITELAAMVQSKESEQADTKAPREIRHAGFWEVFRAGCIQFLAIYGLLIFFSENLADFLHIGDIQNWMLMAFSYIFLSVFVWMIMPIAIKWIVIGRFKPGRYPLWGSYFLRWWIVRSALRFVPMDYLSGTPILPFYLRMMGAKIGKGCYIGTRNLLLPDLVQVGDGAHIGYNVDILSHEIRDGWLYLSPVRIGAQTYVGTNSIVFLGSEIEDGAMLGEQSLAPRHSRIPGGQYWQGSPAAPAVMPKVLRELMHAGNQTSGGYSVRMKMLYWISAVVLYLIMFASQAPCVAMIEGPLRHHQWLLALALLIPGGVANVLFSCALIAGSKWLILPRLSEGTYSLYSAVAWKKWFCDKLISTSLDVVYSVYATIYTKYWLRLLGVKTGRGSEISTVSFFDPNMLSLAPYSFISDQATLGSAVYYKGHFTVLKTSVASKAFIGNCAHQSVGTHVEENSLLGVLSYNQGKNLDQGSSWLGSPAIRLQRREHLTCFADKDLFTPPMLMVCMRYMIDFIRIIIPQIALSIAFVATLMLQESMAHSFDFTTSLLLSPLCFFAVGIVMVLICVLFKWCLVGRYHPRIAPLWSFFVWRSEMATSLYENISLPLFMSWFTGSPVFNHCLRLFGCRIGSRVFFDSTYITEFDMISVMEDSAVAENVSLQTHLFEDRIMKISHVELGKGAVVGHRAVVLYDTLLNDYSVTSPLSLVMKGERLPEKTSWCGIPAGKGNDLGKVITGIAVCMLIGFPIIATGTPVQSSSLEIGQLIAPNEYDSSIFTAADWQWDHRWDLETGIGVEQLTLGKTANFQKLNLRSFYASINFEYDVNEIPIFSLNTLPGYYGQDGGSTGLFDAPVKAVLTLPVTNQIFAVGGFNYEAYSRNPWLPVFGIAMEPAKNWQLKLVFPESELSYSCGDDDRYFIFAGLVGHSYQSSNHTALEYYETQVGAGWEHDFNNHFSMTTRLGWLPSRVIESVNGLGKSNLSPATFMSLALQWSW